MMRYRVYDFSYPITALYFNKNKWEQIGYYRLIMIRYVWFIEWLDDYAGGYNKTFPITVFLADGSTMTYQ